MKRSERVLVIVGGTLLALWLFLGGLASHDAIAQMFGASIGATALSFALPFWVLLRGRVPLWLVLAGIAGALYGVLCLCSVLESLAMMAAPTPPYQYCLRLFPSLPSLAFVLWCEARGRGTGRCVSMTGLQKPSTRSSFRAGWITLTPFLLAVLSGLLFAISLPPENQEWASWAALMPLLVAAVGRRPLEALGLGLLAGAVAGALHAGWNRDTERLFWAYLPFLWLMLLFGLAALASSWARRHTEGMPWVLFVTCLGVTGEWLTTWLPLPLNIALCQYRDLTLIQIAAVTGIWGVSFLLWLVNAALADAFLKRRLRTVPMAVALVTLALALSFGVISRYQETAGPPISVAAIQDFTGDETGDLVPQAPDAGTGVDRVAMTREAAARGAKLIVWSEECLGSAFVPSNPDDETRALARDLRTSLVVGYSDDSRPKPFNCAGLIGPDGTVQGVHHKIHLYLGESQTVQRGGPPRAYATALGRIGMEVCFDSCYTGVTRQIARDGARIIVMPNYDPPSPHGVLHELHGAMLPFRAVENHVPFVRADSNGLSQVVAADGRVVAQGPLYGPDVLMGTIALGDGQGTPFTRWGDWLAYLCLMGAILDGVLIGNSAVSRRRRTRAGAAATTFERGR